MERFAVVSSKAGRPAVGPFDTKEQAVAWRDEHAPASYVSILFPPLEVPKELTVEPVRRGIDSVIPPGPQS